MKLAKDHLDVGIYTNERKAMLEFWQHRVGLPYEELLPAGGGVHQHRFGMNGSVFKLNHSRDPLPPAPRSGYRELLIARPDVREPRSLGDPNSNRVTLVPPGHEDVVGIGVRLAVRDAAAFHAFYGRALELPDCGANAYRVGDSILFFEEDPSAVRTELMRAPGYRYTTIQVWDVEAEHARILERGGEEAQPPVTLGRVARISFVRDPDGNWIEISQRASLTGSLD